MSILTLRDVTSTAYSRPAARNITQCDRSYGTLSGTPIKRSAKSHIVGLLCHVQFGQGSYRRGKRWVKQFSGWKEGAAKLPHPPPTTTEVSGFDLARARPRAGRGALRCACVYVSCLSACVNINRVLGAWAPRHTCPTCRCIPTARPRSRPRQGHCGTAWRLRGPSARSPSCQLCRCTPIPC
jgi:hypothetical protein